MNERDKLAHAGRLLAPDQLSDDPPIRSLTVRALAVLLLFTLVIAALAFVERPVRRGGGGTTTAISDFYRRPSMISQMLKTSTAALRTRQRGYLYYNFIGGIISLLILGIFIAIWFYVSEPPVIESELANGTTANTADPADPQAHTLPSETYTGDSP